MIDFSWLKKYLHIGLDLDNWDVVGCLPTGKPNDAVFLMRRKSWGLYPYCIKHKGDNGRYFRTFHDMAAWYFKAYSRPLTAQEWDALCSEYRNYRAGK